MLKQITVFLENKPGRMEEVTGCLADENINLHALSLADTTDFGILRMIVSDTKKTMKVLKDRNFMVKTADVIAVALDHSPGSLHKVLRELNAVNLSIEYIYAFTSRHKDYDAIVILSIGDQTEAIDKITKSGLVLLNEKLFDQIDNP